MTTIRGSKLDSVLACHGAQLSPQGYELRTHSTASRLGTATHEPLAKRIAGQHEGNLSDYAIKWDVSPKELERLFYKGIRLFNEVKEYFPNPRTEVYHEIQPGKVRLTGHVDVLDYRADYNMVVVADHKTGWLDHAHIGQIKTYGLLGLDIYPQAEKVLGILLRVREEERDQEVWTRAQLNEWYATRVEPIDGDYSLNPNPMCMYCGLRGQCRGYEELIRKAGQLLAGKHEEPTPRELYDAYSSYKRLLEVAHGYLRDQAGVNGGVLEYDEVHELQLRSIIKSTVHFGQAMHVLPQHLAPGEIAALAKISKSALRTAIMEKYPSGEKGKAFAGVCTQLDEVGALIDKATTQLRKVKRHALPVVEEVDDE